MSLQHLHTYWFPSTAGWPDDQYGQRWFAGGEEVDDYLKTHFLGVVQTALDGGYVAEAQRDDQLAVARIVALDQLPRNVYRGTERAFAGDTLALRGTREMMEAGRYERLTVSEKVFVLMPLEHAEELAAQEDSVRLFTELCNTAPPEQQGMAQGWIQYATEHRDVIARFGRFPYRNKVLGRASTPEEERWLAEGANTYGQG